MDHRDDIHPDAARLALRYARAVDEGDLETIDDILAAAIADPELDRLVGEIDLALHDELALSPLAADAATVRSLLRQHLPSGFPEPSPAHLTVGEIAARLVANGEVPAADADAGRRLVSRGEPLPAQLTRVAITDLANHLGEQVSERFWTRFRDAAIAAAMGRGQARANLAATRPQRPPRNSALGEERVEYTSHDPRQIARRIYAEAGLNLEVAAPGIAPLRVLTSSYPIRVVEVPGLTYQRAAEVLLKESGITLDVPTADVRLAGFLCCVMYESELLGCIILNADDPVALRRFSEAHELAHYILHFLPSGSSTEESLFWEGLAWPSDDDALPAGHLSGSEGVGALAVAPLSQLGRHAEDEANAVAAELLMPEPACRMAVARYGTLSQQPTLLVHRLAGDMLVSRQAMQRRLAALGLLTSGRG